MLSQKKFTKIIALLIVIVTILSVFNLPITANAASLSRVTKVKTYNKVTYLGNAGNWRCYSHAASVSWKAVSGADYYQIRYRNGDWTQVTKIVYGTSYRFPGYICHGFGATLSMPYYYWVQIRAVDVNGKNVTYGPWSFAKTAWC